MKINKKLEFVLEIKDLARSKMKVSHVADIPELANNYSVTRLNDIGIFVGGDKAHFVNLSNLANPEILSSVNLIHDPMYGNKFLGFCRDYALFAIAYQGVEIVALNEFLHPQSLGLNKNYGSPPARMLFKDNLAITNNNMVDISDIFNPKIIKEFESPASDFVIYHDNLIYTSRSNNIHMMSLNPSTKFKKMATLDCPFNYGFSNIGILGEKYILAASGNGIAVIELSPNSDQLELIKLLNLDIIPDNFYYTDSSFITRSIREPDDVLVAYNIKNPLTPVRIFSFSFDTDQLWYFMANKEYVVCLCSEGLEKQSLKKSLIVIENHSDLQPELIGDIKIDLSSGFYLVDNYIYVFSKEGLTVFEIK